MQAVKIKYDVMHQKLAVQSQMDTGSLIFEEKEQDKTPQ